MSPSDNANVAFNEVLNNETKNVCPKLDEYVIKNPKAGKCQSNRFSNGDTLFNELFQWKEENK